MIENNYQGTQSAMLKGCGLAILLMIVLVFITGCDENDNENGSLRAVLSVQESPNVPGRIELDPRGSPALLDMKVDFRRALYFIIWEKVGFTTTVGAPVVGRLSSQ